jgi:sulfotransferase
MTAQFIGVTGLPRAGSTLLCQLLAQHPEVHCEGHSSPLCNTLLGIRRLISDDTFFLSQFDSSFEASYAHLASAMQGFLRGWNHDVQKKSVVDKNRAWLHAVELLLSIEPDAQLVVCLRELGQIYGSIEAQHQRTILVDFIDHLADFDIFRARRYAIWQEQSHWLATDFLARGRGLAGRGAGTSVLPAL